MVGLSVHLLGPLELRADRGRHDLPASLKAQELLCYLLLHRDRPVSRANLSCALWPDLDAAHALKNLRQALWQLQSTLGHGETQVLDVTPRSVAIRPGSTLWLDVAEFERVFERTRGPAAQPLGPANATAADRAITLYRGDLLDGFDFEWCIVEREWLQSAYLTMLDRLMVYCEVTGEYELGIDYGERILRVDRAREYTHRRMMFLNALLGNRTGALRQYARCVVALRDELDVPPATSTVALRDRIRSGDEFDRPDRVPAQRVPLSHASSAFGERIRRVQQTLGEMQAQLQSDFLPLDPESPIK